MSDTNNTHGLQVVSSDEVLLSPWVEGYLRTRRDAIIQELRVIERLLGIEPTKTARELRNEAAR